MCVYMQYRTMIYAMCTCSNASDGLHIIFNLGLIALSFSIRLVDVRANERRKLGYDVDNERASVVTLQR